MIRRLASYPLVGHMKQEIVLTYEELLFYRAPSPLKPYITHVYARLVSYIEQTKYSHSTKWAQMFHNVL